MISVTEATSMTTYRAGSNAAGSAVSRVRGSLPQPMFTANTPTGAVTWSDGGAGGTFAPSGVNNANATYTPANKTQNVVISATDPTNTQTYALLVYGTVPIQPQVGFEVESDIETKVKFARDRTRYFREDGDLEIGWVFAWDKRERDQKDELQAFWRAHRKTTQFYLVDVEGNILNKVWFVSSLKWSFNGANSFNLAASFRGIDEEITASDAEPVALYINAGGYTIAGTPEFIQDVFFTGGTNWYWGAITPDTSGLVVVAPTEVYRWCRFGDTQVEYFITGLRPNVSHSVRLQFCADTTRTVTPVVQGGTWSNVVIPAAYDVIEVEDTVVSDGNGNIRVIVNKVSGTNALLSAVIVTEL